MTLDKLLPLIALLGWLVLAAGAFHAHRTGAKKIIVMVLAWGAIFLLTTAVFKLQF